MITLTQAHDAYRAHVKPPPPALLSLDDALGRVIAREARAPAALPRFHQSAMDGYALRARDVRPHHLTLRVSAQLVAGQAPATLEPGTCARIATGAALPHGADCVVRQEDAAREGDLLTLRALPSPGQDVRSPGEQLEADAPLAHPGDRLTPGRAAALGMAGVDKVWTYAPPQVAVAISGAELIDASAHARGAAMHDANTPLLRHLLHQHHLTPRWCARVDDTLDALRQTLRDAQRDASLLITTGGASVGPRDLWREAARLEGAREVFWQVAQRPARPMGFAMLGDTAWLMLPGNPGAALAALAAHLPELLAALTGAQAPAPRWRAAHVADAAWAAPHDTLTRLILTCDDDDGALQEAGPPHHALTMARASGVLAVAPKNTPKTPARWRAL